MGLSRSATERTNCAESTAARSSGCAISARLFVAVAMAAITGVGCSGRGTAASPQGAAGVAASSSPAPTAASTRVQEAAFTEDADGARLVLSANAPLLYTAYEPRPDLLVIDLPGIGIADRFTTPAPSGTLVTSVKVEPITEMGKQMTRLSVAHREGAHFDIRSLGQGLALSFDSGEAIASAPVPAETVAVVAPVTPDPAPAPTASPAARSVRIEEVKTASRVHGENAHALEEIRAVPGNGTVTVSLLGDGSFAPRTFALDNPPRVVIDLPGVKNEVRRRAMPVKSDLVTRIRVSQFQSAPEMVTRIVLDLTRPLPHAVRPDGEHLAVVVGASDALVEAPAIAHAVPAAETRKESTRAPASRTEIAAAPGPAAESHPAPVSETVATKPDKIEPAALSAPADATAPKPAPAVAEAAPAVSPSRKADAPAAGTGSSAPLSESALHAQADQAIRTAAAQPAATAAPAPAAIRPSAKASRAVATPGKSVSPASSKRDEALFEAAAAVLQQEEGGRPEGSGSGAGGGVPQASSFQPRTISESQTQFTGEPISLDLKDADIKDVFRTISQLTQLNIVVDPEVRGTVTVQLEDVPWDQALDLILKQNGLGYVLENNIMRIATTQKLQAEQSDRARLAEARQAAEPTRTLIKKLSYAKASEITPTIKSVMSKRGDIVVDARTNTLIIREIPTYLPAVLQLIDQLDTATPQVMIESRIVETTKSLGRSLGITWGANGAADVAHGNTTNLIFPNNIVGATNVGLGNGPTVASVRLGNVLDTFNLDIALTAAENQGLLKIISSPKVAALTNTAASIQSGVQIPVQTNVNNTTTVIYVDATLRLTVTPQITNEGTILLDVQVSKREPAVALNLSLGQNVPLTIREYRGQILVRDGGTTVIGGIFQINDQDQNNMIPGLWKIPILGNLFRNTTRTEKHDELLIFITPRILRS